MSAESIFLEDRTDALFRMNLWAVKIQALRNSRP